MDRRGQSSVLGTGLAIVIVIGLVSVCGLALFDYQPDTSAHSAILLTPTVELDTQTIVFTHHAGPALDPDQLSLTIAVNGDPIAHQPPIPFFAARGFVSGPTGPFNSKYDSDWNAGTRASIQLASTNTQLEPNDRVTITLRRGDVLLVQYDERL